MSQLSTVADPERVQQDAAPGLSPWFRWGGGLVLLELALVFAPTVQWLVERWTISVWHNAHGMFVPPIAAYLVWDELRGFKGPPVRASAWGFAFLVPALALHILDTGMHTQLLSAAAMVLILPGLSLLFLGVERTRAIGFPLAFLLFALPIPLGFTEQLHLALRHLTTAATSSILPVMGVPVYVEGTTLHTAGGVLEVADACSGFSTLYAAAAVAFLTAFSAPSRRRQALVLLAAAPLAIAANVVRVTLLVLLVLWYGGEILDTPVHSLSGMMTFALALPVIFWLGGPSRRRAQA